MSNAFPVGELLHACNINLAELLQPRKRPDERGEGIASTKYEHPRSEFPNGQMHRKKNCKNVS